MVADGEAEAGCAGAQPPVSIPAALHPAHAAISILNSGDVALGRSAVVLLAKEINSMTWTIKILKPFVWTKSADQILSSIAGYARRTLSAHPA
jgi:hypothetical protein